MFPHFCRRFALSLLVLIAAPAYSQEQVRVSVEGIDGRLETNVRSHLDLERLSCKISELTLRNALASADSEISAALRALGYYRANWRVTRSRDSDNDCWRVDIAVTPGAQATLKEVDIRLEGDEVSGELTALAAQLPLKAGDGLDHGHYESSKKRLRQRALSLGYFEAHFSEHRLTVNTVDNTAEITLILNTGPRYRFGAIGYPQTALNQELIERFQTFRSGEPFDSRKLIAFQNNLINSQYFDTVSINQSEPDPASKAVDLDLQLTDKRRFESVLGAGYSTDIGPRLNYTLNNRRVNRDGDTYQVSSQFSPVQSNLGIQYQQPGDDPVKEKTLWFAGWQDEETDSSDSTAYKVEVAKVKVLDNGWLQTRSLTVLNETYRVGDDDDNSTLVFPGINWSHNNANDSRYPTRGWRLSVGARGGLDQALSDTTFLQATADFKAIAPLLGGRLIGRAGLGGTYVEDFSRLPATLRFFAGGDNSVRGFAYETLAPENDKGEVQGGKHQVTGSIEYDHLVFGDYGVALFYDAGTAFDTRDFTLYESAGFGVRWHSPIGPIRVDFAFPLDNGGFRVHLSMGPDL